MKQFYCLILIVFIWGIAQIHCNSVVPRNQWQDAAEELDYLTIRANYLLNISELQVERTNIYLHTITQAVIVNTQDKIYSKIFLASLDLNQWKELTRSFGLEPPSECVTSQEAALKEIMESYVKSISTCGQSLVNIPNGEINSIVLSIIRLKSIIDNLYDQFYACGEDTTCLDLLYPQISEARQYNTEIRDKIFSIEKVVSDFNESIETGCVTPILEAEDQSISGILTNSKNCLQTAITA